MLAVNRGLVILYLGDILDKIESAIPRSTRKTTLWSVNTWREWVQHCRSNGSSVPPELDEITNDELNNWLACFVVEARNKDGELYKGGTLYSLCSGIQRYVREKRQAVKGSTLTYMAVPASAISEVLLTAS